ncbi:MAG: hypothetical protein ACXAEU_03480 [Candidatus Hodarchaeales archaeon]|jgi:peptide subunit release factor 1 (eRF1)
MNKFNFLTNSELDTIIRQQGYNGMRSLFSLYVPKDSPIISVIKDLRNEHARIRRKMVFGDDHRELVVELLQELISLLEKSDFQGEKSGLAIFFGMNKDKKKLRWIVKPPSDSVVTDYLLVCDHTFYIDSCLE